MIFPKIANLKKSSAPGKDRPKAPAATQQKIAAGLPSPYETKKALLKLLSFVVNS
tara:strand:- start:311 stop:475 length:165 start_codon:yes stop_codon:yes gene_type:complete